MKFTCSTKDIAGAVGAASKVVNAHTTVPILSNVLLTASDNEIRVRATDLEVTLEQAFPAEVGEPGSITVPAKLFSGYLGNLPPGLLELSGSPTRASVKWERSNYDFHALPPDEYPPLPSTQKGTSFAIGAKAFRDGVNATIFAASSEEDMAEGGVNIRLRVSGQRDLAVDLVRNLERSQRFLSPRLANETAQSQEHGLTPVSTTVAPGSVEFDIMSGYNPLPESPKDREQENLVQKSASDQAKPQTPAGPKLPVKPQPVISHSIAIKPKPLASTHAKKAAASIPANKQPVKVGAQ